MIRRPPEGKPPKHLVDALAGFVEYERVATEAIVTRRVPLLKEALSLHPWTRNHRQLHDIVDEIVMANAAVMAEA